MSHVECLANTIGAEDVMALFPELGTHSTEGRVGCGLLHGREQRAGRHREQLQLSHLTLFSAGQAIMKVHQVGRLRVVLVEQREEMQHVPVQGYHGEAFSRPDFAQRLVLDERVEMRVSVEGYPVQEHETRRVLEGRLLHDQLARERCPQVAARRNEPVLPLTPPWNLRLPPIAAIDCKNAMAGAFLRRCASPF